MLEFFLDGKVIELIHVLEKPEVVMEPLSFLVLFHHLANIEKVKVNCVHINILALVLLQAEVRLLKWRPKHIVSVVLNSISGLNCHIVLLFELIPQFLCFVIKILPYYIVGLLFLRWLQSLLPFDDCNLFFFEGGLFFNEVKDILSSVLNHVGKVVHSVFRNSSLFRVVLKS